MVVGEVKAGVDLWDRLWGWLRKSKAKGNAQFRLSWTARGNVENLKIENTSQTATAENVMLYLDGIPYPKCSARIAGEKIHSVYPALHCQILMFAWGCDATAPDEVYVEWTDKSGKRKTSPVPFHALPKY